MRANSLARWSIVTAVILTSLSCTPPSQRPVEVRPVYQRDVISLRLKADPQLNLYAGTSHALHVCVYQLTNPNPFDQYSDDMMGISKLMNCERFDPAVALANRIVVQPGDDLNIPIDRAEGARFVGIAAGYYSLNRQNAIRRYQIPVIEEQRGGQIVTRPAPLNIDLYLGPQGIQSTR